MAKPIQEKLTLPHLALVRPYTSLANYLNNSQA